MTFCFREVLPANQRFIFGTEGKVDFGYFLVPILASQSPDLRKRSQKRPDNKRKIETSSHVTQFFLNVASIIIITIVIIINILFYVDLEITPTIM